MSNLPNSQIDNNIDDINDSKKDGESVISIKPGSIFGTAGKPAIGAESGFVPETPTPSEIQKSPETIVPVPAPKPPVFEEEVETSDPLTETKPLKNVADKTDEITTLHDIQKTEDKLTKKADEEEEHFIEEVEMHHGDL